MTQTADAVVIGAGIVGAACAEALARDGLRVLVVESGSIGGGATAAGMGHLVVMDDSEAQFALTRYSCEIWNQLARSLPPEVGYERCGTLWVAADDEEMAAVRQKELSYRAGSVRVEVLDPASLASAEPNLRPGLAGALLVPDDSVIYAPFAASWMIDQARHHRAALRLGVRVIELHDDGVSLDDSTRVSAGLTVCASGTWAPSLLPSLAVRPRKGQLAITDRYPGFVRHQLVELGYLKSAHGHATESVAFNVQPRKTGQVLIGSSRQYDAVHPDIDMPMLRRMLARAIEYMPALANLSVIRIWAGFRAATSDKLPVVGPYPGRRNLYLATGHEGLGITTSVGTARLLADLIAGRAPAIDPAPYLPSRFDRTCLTPSRSR
jgi:glycine/D-amino acid oxidase-like deaminating enzyme